MLARHQKIRKQDDQIRPHLVLGQGPLVTSAYYVQGTANGMAVSSIFM